MLAKLVMNLDISYEFRFVEECLKMLDSDAPKQDRLWLPFRIIANNPKKSGN